MCTIMKGVSPSPFSISVQGRGVSEAQAKRAKGCPDAVDLAQSNPCAASLPSVGCYKDWGLERYTGVILGEVNPDILACYDTIGVQPLLHALTDVPAQSNGWSCGINSSARFLAMLGKPLRDFVAHHNGAPRHHMGPFETGPGTAWLAGHIRRDGKAEGLDVHAHMTDAWEPQQRDIDASLAAGRPALVSVEVSDRMLHWLPLVGRGRGADGDYLAIDTNGSFARILGGSAGLRQRMNLNAHSIHTLPMRDDRVAAFNSILARSGPLRLEDGSLLRICHRHAAGLAGDQNRTANLLESVGELAGNAADAVGDGAKALGNAVEDAGKEIGNGVETAANAVRSLWNRIF